MSMMRFTAQLQGEVLLTVNEHQPPLAESSSIPQLGLVDVYPEMQIPDSLRLIQTKRLLDLGGSGDCFFMALNAANSSITRIKNGQAEMPSAPDMYEILGLADFTFIEDQHITRIMSAYDFSLIVMRTLDGKMYMQRFGDLPDVVYLYCDFPRHYLLLDQVFFEGQFSSFAELDSRPLPEREEIIQEQEEVALPEVYTYHDTFSPDAEDCYREDVSVSYLTQYVDSRYTLRKGGFQIVPSDSKVYYKLRHNLFKTVFLDFLGLENVEERPFTQFGIDSNRTPDLFMMVDGIYILIEFTVVKRFATSLKTKQSKNKYAVEVDMIRSKGGNIKQFYPTLALDESVSALSLDVTELAQILGKELYSDPEEVFIEIQTTINEMEFNISELMPNLLLNQDETASVTFRAKMPTVEKPAPFVQIVQKVGIKRQRDQNTYNLIRRNARALERQLRRTIYSAKFILIVNMRHNKIYADVDPMGVPKNLLLSMVQTESPDLLKLVKHVGGASDSLDPFKLMGESKLSSTEGRSKEEKVSHDTEQFEVYYKNKLIKSAKNKEMPVLVDSKLSEQVEKVESIYNGLLAEKRKAKNVVVYNKNWFIMPCLTDLNVGKYKKLELTTGLPLTDRLLRAAMPRPFEKYIERNMNVNSLDEHLKKVNKAHNALLELLNHNRRGARSIRNLRKPEDVAAALGLSTVSEEIMASLAEYQETRREMVKRVGESTRTSYSNRINLSSGYMKHNWPAEMEHFNGPRGVVKVCEDTSVEVLQTKVTGLLERLWQECPEPTIDNVLNDSEPNAVSLKKVLNQMKTLADERLAPLKRTQIMHDLQFVSRLAYTVLYYSNIKSNKEDFYFDNLGYKDAIVFIKGGKKVLSTKRSRLFKVIYPIKDGASQFYESPNTKIIKHGDKIYCVSPWQNWSFVMMKKFMELYYVFPSYCVSSGLESGLTEESYRKFLSNKVLNMYSQRRKVEIWYGYFRYLYLNSLASHTSVLDLVNDMVDHEYDPYFSYCQKRFALKYKDIKSQASDGKIFDMVTDSTFDNFDLCAEKFDECIFMTPAPFDRVNEHLKNLRAVLELHKKVTDKFSQDPVKLLEQTSADCHSDTYYSDLMSDDLMFDPSLSFCVGKFCGDYIAKMVSKSEMAAKFTQILQETYTNVSSSKGMRSAGSHFWGDKGHDVIFGTPGMLKIAKDLVRNLPETNSEFRSKLTETHKSFTDRIGEFYQITMEFDIKDKAQWKGSREIYVMSEPTKVVQSPLEKFFSYLCHFTPNELIHRSSHSRPKFIHSQIFEFESTTDVATFATLDCRKWAPMSNLWKYYFFVQGMSNVLPKEFVDYFNSIWSLMFYKKVRIQKFYVELLRKNSQTEPLLEYLKERDDGDFEFTMPYSFMMGIFNYLSSLMHAASQLYFDHKISRPQGVSFNLLAHSDDSGGVVFSSSEEKNLEIFRQYEMFQKSLNHLMSKKKCALSDKFFEMISIMYANKRLIPMTHKFLSNVSFEPKGKGWVDDISTVVSKVVEIFSNGGTMIQCYITMLTMAEMIRKFYHIPRVKSLSRIPLAYGGVFNLHPLHLILLGADAQEVLLDVTESEGERSFRIGVAESLFGEYFPGKGANVNYRIPYYKHHKLTDEISNDDAQRLKLISGVIYNTTLGQAAGHYSRLQDPAYVYSLSGVDMCQIYTMTLFTKTLILSQSGDRKCDLRRLTTKYSILKALGLKSTKAKKSLSSFTHYAKAAESITIDLEDMCVSSKKTCKPINYSTFSTLGLGLNFSAVNELIAYMKDPKLSFMFPDTYRMETLKNWVKASLKFSNDYTLEDYLMKVSSKDLEKNRSSYCFIPSGVSVDTIERFWTYINFYCTRRYFISKKKPQYFTIDRFKLWDSEFDSLKHMYLLVRVALRCELKDPIIEKLKGNASCSACSYKEENLGMVEEVLRIRSLPSYSFLNTSLPFAVYTEPQRRAINVWYGRAEFVLYTRYGSVEVSKRLGEIYHIYNVTDVETINQVHFMLKNFLLTRGIQELDTAYSLNDTGAMKLGFGDLHQPKACYPGERGMMQPNSIVNIRDPPRPRLYKEAEKYTLNGMTVDFEIYQNYDINESFYKEHGLDGISDLIFSEEALASPESIRQNATSTKVYEVLQLDPTHNDMGSIMTKYSPGLLLGSERSLTRALVMADAQGKLQYRSTSTPKVLDTSVFEGLSHKDIPVTDLADQFSFARVTHRERSMMDKIVNSGSITKRDEPILDALVTKMGIKPTMQALTTARVVFSNLIYKDLKFLAKDVVEDYMYTMVKAALNTIEDRTTVEAEYMVAGTKTQISQQIALAIRMKSSPRIMAELLTKLILRAQKTNSGRFWEERKNNIYAAIVVPRIENFKTLMLFHQGVLSKLGQTRYRKLSEIRQIIISFRVVDTTLKPLTKNTLKRRKQGSDYFEGVLQYTNITITNFRLDEDSDDFNDDMDNISGGDDPEGQVEREWDEDEDSYSAYIYSDADILCAAEDTLLADFSEVTLISQVLMPSFPWLGPCDVEMAKIRGVPMYRTTYPGHLVRLQTSADIKEIETRRFESRPIPIDEDLEENSSWAGKLKVDSDLFELKTEEEVYNYQVSVLRNIGIKDPESHSKNFFKLSDSTSQESFWKHLFNGMNLKAAIKIKKPTQQANRRSNVLPGFTGNLKDVELRAELNTMFSNHAEEIVSGNHCLNRKSYSVMLKMFQRLYRRTDDRNVKAYIIILMSVMKDCIITEQSDSWFSDSLLNAIDLLEDDIDLGTDVPPPSIGNFTRNYKIVNPYD
nr:RNA-dependent RNA polymerase [Phytophthora castaneae negative stranded RNA virus 1]